MTNADQTLLIDFFGEIPSKPAAIAALTLYLAISVVILGITCKTRSWFMLTVVLTGLLEAAGFGSRLWLLQSPSFTGIAMMQCFLIISPVLLAMVEYICLGKLVAMSRAGRESRFMRWQSRLFALSDLVCLFLQGGAGGMMANSENQASMARGRQLMLVGLVAQLCFFSLFACICVYVHRSSQFGMRGLAPARVVFGTLYATIVLLFGRNIFRVAEFSQGWDGELATHEAYFYGFDFALIFSCFLLFAVLHYGVHLPKVRDALMAVEETPVQDVVQVVVVSGGKRQGSLDEKGSEETQGWKMMAATGV